ncbi:MAG: hypothetical protein FJ125_18220, partial [Deltaproteobacteria bacterium]|nr:hypothetical protein [Deltaproteobacteria bacterium]
MLSPDERYRQRLADLELADRLPPALQRRFPELVGRLPWLGLGRFPTPVQEVHGLGLPLWIKREDLSSPAPGLPGGNKVRKLEPIL